MSMFYHELGKKVQALNYKWFDSGDYNLNIVGVRSADLSLDYFNDKIYVAFKTGSIPHIFNFVATTDPGGYYTKNPINKKGTAILKPGQYSGLWEVGKHRNLYEALTQKNPVIIYRDNNKDSFLDLGVGEDNGMFGINLHRASENTLSNKVDKWSAGCQVIRDPLDFDILISLCKKAIPLWGNSFTYTLLEEE